MPRAKKYAAPGRPINSGRFKKPTQVMRVPSDRVKDIYRFLEEQFNLPLYGGKVSAGFPSPTEDFIEDKIDLNQHLIQKPAATFLVRVTGDSMIKVGIFQNDLLVVDRSVEAQHGKIVIAVLNGELTVKRLYKKGDVVRLVAENDQYPPIEVKGDLHIWGVVQHVIHSF